MKWIKLRPSGGGGVINLLHLADYSMSYSGTDRDAHDTLTALTPATDITLPWTPDSTKTYQVICLEEQVTGSCEVSSSAPETDLISSAGCSMTAYLRINKVVGGYNDYQLGYWTSGSGVNSGIAQCGCGTTIELSNSIETLQTRLVVGEILAGIAAPDTTVSRAFTCSGQLWIVEY